MERHRIEGSLPTSDFLAQTSLALWHLAFDAGKWSEAVGRLRAVLEQCPHGETAAEAEYGAGVSRRRGTGNAAALSETALGFGWRYQDPSWAKRASAWKPQARGSSGR